MPEDPLTSSAEPPPPVAAADQQALLRRAATALRRLPPDQLRTVTEFAEWQASRPSRLPASAAASTAASAAASAAASQGAVPVSGGQPAAVTPAGEATAHSDWERFAGEKLAARLGIAALVLGLGFFVKYAFETGLLAPLGRVLLTVAGGGALLGLGAVLRRNLPAFASVLAGGGLAVLYLSGTLAFQQYHLVSQAGAFGLLVATTAGAIALAVAWSRVELAVVALVGGLVAPLLLRTGVARYEALFTYLLVLDAGMLALALRQRWPLLARIAWPATTALFGGWLVNQVVGHPLPAVGGPVGFGGALVSLFLLYDGLRFVRAPADPVPLPDRLLVGGQAVGLVVAGETLLGALGPAAPWWGYTVLWWGGAALFATVGAAVRWHGGARTGTEALLAAALGLFTLGVAMQVQGVAATLIWTLESLLLVGLGLRLPARRLRLAGLALFAFTLAHLMVAAWSFSPAGRVVAFVSTGALLLVGSFLYQKLQAAVAVPPPGADG